MLCLIYLCHYFANCVTYNFTWNSHCNETVKQIHIYLKGPVPDLVSLKRRGVSDLGNIFVAFLDHYSIFRQQNIVKQ